LFAFADFNIMYWWFISSKWFCRFCVISRDWDKDIKDSKNGHDIYGGHDNFNMNILVNALVFLKYLSNIFIPFALFFKLFFSFFSFQIVIFEVLIYTTLMLFITFLC